MIFDNLGHEAVEVLVEAGCKRGVVGKLGELAVDSSDDFGVIVPYEVKVLFFVLL